MGFERNVNEQLEIVFRHKRESNSRKLRMCNLRFYLMLASELANSKMCEVRV